MSFIYFFVMKPLVYHLKNLSHGCLGDRGLRIELLIYLSNATLPQVLLHSLDPVIIHMHAQLQIT